MKEKGISLIALIITIIVIIILAAISIAGVSGVVERSRYAKFCGDLDAVQDAVSQAYGDKLVKESLENQGQKKTSKEIYEWVAGGEDPQTEEVDGKTLAELEKSDRLGLDLPKYGDGKWYVDVNTGEVYLLPGFAYGDKVYTSKADIQKGGSEDKNDMATSGEITTTEPVISTDQEGQIPAGDKLLAGIDTAYITFTASQKNGNVTIDPPVPYAVTTNGTYQFTITGEGGKTKGVSVDVDNFVEPISLDSYINYYADIDDNGSVDGIIFADLAVGSDGEKYWRAIENDDYGGSHFTIPKTENTDNLKHYYVKQKSFDGPFGIHPVLAPIEQEKRENRFYVMALDDLSCENSTIYYWYDKQKDGYELKIEDYLEREKFGLGEDNTEMMIEKWKSNIGGDMTTRNMWRLLDAERTKDEDLKKWFVPSKGEWGAFAYNVGVTLENQYNLNGDYWTSSSGGFSAAYRYFFRILYSF